MATKDLSIPLNEINAKSLVNNHDTFLFDCDGVLWNFPEIFPGAIDLLHHLTQQVRKRRRFLIDEYAVIPFRENDYSS